MSELRLITTEKFCNIECDFYRNNKDDVLITREQIGRALEYSDPQKAIDKLHSRHKERLNKFSVTTKVTGTDGKAYNTTLYTPKGIYEICRWSQQNNANAFIDWVWEILDKIRKREAVLIKSEIFNQFKGEISNIVKGEVQKEIGKVENKCSTYYKPSCATKFSIGKYIKDRLGINKTNKEYDLVKQRIFIVLRAKKWEDIPMDVLSSSMKVVDESIDVIKKDRPYQQMDFLGNFRTLKGGK
jgi:prophage antirepressor-like protein